MSGNIQRSDSLEDVEMGGGSGNLLHQQSTTPTANGATTTTPRRVHYSDNPADPPEAFASGDETAPPYSNNSASRSVDGEVQKASFSQSRDNFGSASIDTPQQRSSGEDDDDDSLTDNI